MTARQFQIISAKGGLPDGVHDDLAQFLAYWRARAVAGLPQRRDIDPLAIVRLLPRVFLLDVETEDFRFSLVGEDITGRYGSIKAKSLGELMSGPELERTIEEHQLCVATRLPVYSQNTLRSASLGDQQIYQRLLTPYGGDADLVTCIAGIMVFRSSAAA